MYYFSNFVLGLTAYLFAFDTSPFKHPSVTFRFGSAVFDSILPIGMILPGKEEFQLFVANNSCDVFTLLKKTRTYFNWEIQFILKTRVEKIFRSDV